ncbi:MAG TPA: SRPBCC domain-containing protein [Steroidobacteraceae bacterium]|nr:SRPBCC domain-containing protein [Steroidobacteraceae bacterium]
MNGTRTPARARFSIERTYDASIEEVWALWTTTSGIESWWGPEGFEVTVTSLDLRPGGELLYMMTAVAPEMAAFMKQSGMPLTTQCRLTYTEVSPKRRLAYRTLADFVPGVEPYHIDTVVEFQATNGGVKLITSFDAMHDDLWTERSRAGHESELRKLDALLAARGKGDPRP